MPSSRAQFTIAATLLIVVCLRGAPSAQQVEPAQERVQALMGLARVRRDAGDRAGARRYFEEARRLRAFNQRELTEYFWLLAGQDSAAALLVGRDVLAAAPDDADVRDRMITEAIATGDENRVRELAAEGQRRDPSAARWPRRLAESHLRSGRADRAAAAFAAASRAADATPRDQAGLAVALEAAGRYAESTAAWERVPAGTRSERQEWELSRLRALAHSAPAAAASAELAAWLRVHPADDAIREALVDAWLRAGQPSLALAALPDPKGLSDHWLRRRASIARAAGMYSVAISAIDELAARHVATTEDRWARLELLIDGGHHPRALAELGRLAAQHGCDDRLFALIDRIPDLPGTNAIIELLSSQKCDDASEWLRRGMERAVAQSKHREALALLERLPAAEQQRSDMRRLAGQLHFWTGDARGAIIILESAIGAAPEDMRIRETLVDAYRAERRPRAAWRIAKPLLEAPALTDERLEALADLALEADQPDQVAPILDRIARRPADAPIRTSLLARSLLARGRPADARALLSSISKDELTPSGALALIDSTLAMSGAEAARDVARHFTATTPAWHDIVARSMMLESIAGDALQAAGLREALHGSDKAAAALADVEVALAAQRPHQALALLAELPNNSHSERAADLESIALAGAGRAAEALAIVSRLREARPESVSLMLREAELSFQFSPTEQTLARVVALSQELAGNSNAAIAAARSLAAVERQADALAALGPESTWRSLPQGGRLVAAQCLQAAGRPQDALDLLANLPVPSAATDALRVRSLVQLASARLAAGDRELARSTASRAIDIDRQSVQAWLVLLDATTGLGNANDIEGVLTRFEAEAMATPALTIGMAERLAALTRSPRSPLLARAASWLERLSPTDDSTMTARDLVRARIMASGERWSEAIEAVDAALRRQPDFGVALKLRAELLSWSGRHVEALAAYDAYLAGHPEDVEARRQQARVAGWSGAFGEARRRYDVLLLAFPDDARIAAEAAAKAAFYEGRWRAAVAAYGRWIALEPDNDEARFEHAEALRSSGDARQADSALSALESSTGHRLAAVALDRARSARRLSAAVVVEQRSANGYAGQRLLDLRERGALVQTTFGEASPTTMTADTAQVEAVGSGAARHGFRLGVNGASVISPRLGLDARAVLWNFSTGPGVATGLRLRASWRPTDRWTVSGGAEREPIFENLATIDQRISASGVFAGAAFESPRASIEARLSRQGLSDGNARTRATVSFSRSVGDRLPHLRLVAWAESLAYRASSASYFAPARHLRLDAGFEYTHEFRTPRFRGDCQRSLAVGYLAGTDSNGTFYQHPSVRFAFEFARGIAIDARASWIQSAVYKERSAFVGLRIHRSQGRR